MRARPNTANAGTEIAKPTICQRVHGCSHECRKTASPRTITARARVLMFSRKAPPAYDACEQAFERFTIPRPPKIIENDAARSFRAGSPLQGDLQHCNAIVRL